MAPQDSTMTAAVTGAGGFIGSHLVQALLRSGVRVRALVRYGSELSTGWLRDVLADGRTLGEDWVRSGALEIVRGDVLDARCVRDLIHDCDQVFHLAALIGIPYSYRAPESYLRVNVQGILNVLEASREECPERVIVTSTSEVYGTALETPMSERHPLQAQSPYAASKTAADKFAESYHLSFGTPVVTLRPFNTYGPRQSIRAVVPAILAQALSPDCPVIRLGNLETVRDITYVEDTVRGFLSVSRAPLATVVGKVYHVASGTGLTIGQIVEAALRVVGTTKSVESVAERKRPEASEVLRLVGDAGRIERELGWRSRVTLEDGLARTAEWIQCHPSADPSSWLD